MWDIHWEFGIDIHTTRFKMDNLQGSIVKHRELPSIIYNNLNGKRI